MNVLMIIGLVLIIPAVIGVLIGLAGFIWDLAVTAIRDKDPTAMIALIAVLFMLGGFFILLGAGLS